MKPRFCPLVYVRSPSVPHKRRESLHSLDVVREHIQTRVRYHLHAVSVAAEVGHQALYQYLFVPVTEYCSSSIKYSRSKCSSTGQIIVLSIYCLDNRLFFIIEFN